MTYQEMIQMQDAAWSAFTTVLKAHGLTALQVSRFMIKADHEDVFSGLEDCLTAVVELTDE